MPIDKNCKSPVSDLIHDNSTHKIQVLSRNALKADSFTIRRQHILSNIHERDLHENYKHFKDYNSVVPIERRGFMILGDYLRYIYGKNLHDRWEVVGYYDGRKFNAKHDPNCNFRILGCFRKGKKGGGMISAQQAYEESTYNGWNNGWRL